MACLLATTWFLIEAFLIPEGLLKWFYLSFYIHPLLLILCQILLWIKLIISWTKRVLAIPYGIVSFMASFLITVLTGEAVDELEDEVFVDALGDMDFEDYSEASYGSNDLNMLQDMFFVQSKVYVVEEESRVVVTGLEEDKDEDASSVSSSQLTLSPGETADGKSAEQDHFCSMDAFIITRELNDLVSVCRSPLTLSPGETAAGKSIERDLFCEMDACMMKEELNDLASICSSRLTLSPKETAEGMCIECDQFYEMDACMMTGKLNDLSSVCSSGLTQILPGADDSNAIKIEQDPFYQKYVQTMAWFDWLNLERTCGIGAILQAGSKEMAHRISSIWGDKAKERLIRSLESDLELVYVAQTCLSWEILGYQQKKVKDLLMNTSTQQTSIQFDHVAVEELQKFQVLLERFTEDERFLDRCRYRSYVQARALSKSLLQVPEISGQVVEGEGREEEEVVGVKLNEVLKAMEDCIRAFYEFVKADKNKEEISSSRWKSSSSLLLKSCLFRKRWSCSTVEDPRDLPLFFDLISILLQKSQRLKDLQGKKKWGVRKKKKKTCPSAEQPQRKKEKQTSLLLTEIDLELVARVLHMSNISSSHLTWCQAKLDNILFCHGKLSRAHIFPLFPS